jgi:hypothetical protein
LNAKKGSCELVALPSKGMTAEFWIRGGIDLCLEPIFFIMHFTHGVYNHFGAFWIETYIHHQNANTVQRLNQH